MDESIRKAVAKQGLGFTLHKIRCSLCYYIAQSFEEEDALERGAPCPKCGQIGDGGGLLPNSYFAVANWVGESLFDPYRLSVVRVGVVRRGY